MFGIIFHSNLVDPNCNTLVSTDRCSQMNNISVWIKEAICTNSDHLEFEKDDFVVLVGPNNSGKSLFLRELYSATRNIPNPKRLIVRESVPMTQGSSEEYCSWLRSSCRTTETHIQKYGFSVTEDEAKSNWRALNLNRLGELFFRLIDAHTRVTTPPTVQSIDPAIQPVSHPVHELYLHKDKEHYLSELLRPLTGGDLILNRCAGPNLYFCIGDRNKADSFENPSVEYSEYLSMCPCLDHQGDGVKSYISILLHFLHSSYFVLLLDEPELFLHPMHARRLGKFLASESFGKQVFIATHSSDFLQGVLESKNERLRLIRITREGGVNTFHEIDRRDLRSFWRDSILFYGKVIDGLFSSSTVLCEGDSDCRFFSSLTSSLDRESTADVLFASCGGKDKIRKVASSLRSLGIETKAILDFDFINDRRRVKETYLSFGGNWDDLKEDYSRLIKQIQGLEEDLSIETIQERIDKLIGNLDKSRKYNKSLELGLRNAISRRTIWKRLKEHGKTSLPRGQITNDCEVILNALQRHGVHVIPDGEMESFLRSVGSKSDRWVNHVLENYEVASAPELDEARKFVTKVHGM